MVKTKKLEDYVVYSSQLDEFLRLRNLEAETLEAVVDSIGALISTPNKTIRDYVRHLVNTLVYNHERYVRGPGDDDKYDALFEAVLEAYPMFQVDSICELLNAKATFENISEPTSLKVSKKLNLKGLKSIETSLQRKVIGQDTAVTDVVNALKLRAAGFSSFTSFFFIGPTGD